MDVLAFCAIVIALAAFVAAPLYGPPRRSEPGAAPDPHAAARLDELEVDRATGLMDDETFAAERAALLGEAPAAPGAPDGAD